MESRRIAVELIGELDFQTVSPEDNGRPFIDVLRNKPFSRSPQDAEVLTSLGGDIIIVRLGGEEKTLCNYDGPIWFEPLDEEGNLLRFYILHRYIAVSQ